MVRGICYAASLSSVIVLSCRYTLYAIKKALKLSSMSIFDEIDKYLPDLDVLSYFIPEDDDANRKKYELLREKYSTLKMLPSKFNEIFVEHGWIATDDLSVPIMEKAVQVFTDDGVKEAEAYLTNEFTAEYFQICLRSMKAIWVFEDRQKLLELAFADHEEGRYHASVPVVLAQIDGLIYDIADQSFYEQDKKLDIFRTESKITGIKNELGSIAKKMNKTRSATKNSSLTFPYRNGILHGRDLGYDNKMVSAKCFTNFFALRPWALFIQQNEMERRQGHDYVKMPKLSIGKRLSQKIDYYLCDS